MSRSESPAPGATPRVDGDLRFAVALTVAFVVATLPRLWAHELWRDEAWLWLVARESGSLDALLAALGRSGQGYLFPFLCWGAARVVASWRAMQALHLGIAAGACFLFARRAPLPRGQRALFVLGYFPAFEYAVLSRHYALGMLLAWAACAFATRRSSRRPAIGAAVALALLCQTTVYGFVLAVAIATGWLVDRALRSPSAIARGERAVAAAIALAGAVAGVVQLVPAAGTSFAPGWRLAWDPALAASVLRLPWRALVPLPTFGLHFWNTNVLDGWPALESAAGVAVLVLAGALLARRPAALATFAVGSAGLLVFAYVKLVGLARHHGHLWLLVAAALWIGGGLRDAGADRADRDDRGRRGARWRSAVLATLLAVHVLAALHASVVDLLRPFSNGPAAAAAIRGGALAELPLLVYREPPASSVTLPLGRAAWAPSRGVFTTHPDWGPEQRDLVPAELRCAVRAFAARQGGDVGVVLSGGIAPAGWPELEPVGAALGAIVESEDFRLWRLRRDRLAATAADAACPGPAPGADARPGLDPRRPSATFRRRRARRRRRPTEAAADRAPGCGPAGSCADRRRSP